MHKRASSVNMKNGRNIFISIFMQYMKKSKRNFRFSCFFVAFSYLK